MNIHMHPTSSLTGTAVYLLFISTLVTVFLEIECGPDTDVVTSLLRPPSDDPRPDVLLEFPIKKGSEAEVMAEVEKAVEELEAMRKEDEPPKDKPDEKGEMKPTNEGGGEEEKPTVEVEDIAVESPIGYEVPCGIRGNFSNRVVGGSGAEPGEFPWQVSLQLTTPWGSRHVCGGALLSSYWVITAGHCVVNMPKKSMFIVAGDHNLYKEEETEQRAYVERIVMNRYDSKTFSNDLALLLLDRKIKLDGNTTAPICLPKPNLDYEEGSAIVTGWGKLSEKDPALPEILQQVELPLVKKTRCGQLYRKAGYGLYLHPCQICAGFEKTGGYDSCQGDSGGPLACLHPKEKRYYLCGIVSWGLGCGRAHFPGVYTETSCFSDWISTVLYHPDQIDLITSDNKTNPTTTTSESEDY